MLGGPPELEPLDEPPLEEPPLEEPPLEEPPLEEPPLDEPPLEEPLPPPPLFEPPEPPPPEPLETPPLDEAPPELDPPDPPPSPTNKSGAAPPHAAMEIQSESPIPAIVSWRLLDKEDLFAWSYVGAPSHLPRRVSDPRSGRRDGGASVRR
jgi:hypothetical protein